MAVRFTAPHTNRVRRIAAARPRADPHANLRRFRERPPHDVPARTPAVTALYAAFAGFVVYVLARDLPLSSCGCLGETDTTPNRLHVAVTAAAATTAAAAAFVPPPTALELTAARPLEGALGSLQRLTRRSPRSTACWQASGSLQPDASPWGRSQASGRPPP